MRRLLSGLLLPSADLRVPDAGAPDQLAVTRERPRGNVIAIVGPTPGVGKSFVACNFVLALASSGRRTLLVDADLRTGGLHREFGLERGAGLAEALAGDAAVEEVVRHGVLPNLDFLSTGRLPEGPAQLLSNPRFPALLAHLARRYDAVVVDSAPILAVADTLLIAPHADIIFQVVRSGITTLSEIEEVERQLRRVGAREDEIIYNDMRSRQSHYGYSAAYK